MKLTILGGTGRTGRVLIEQSLAAGHDVTAFTRTPWRLGIEHAKLAPIHWNMDEADKAVDALAGSDAVLSVMGPVANVPGFAVSRSMELIITAMQKHAVRRLIVTAGAGVRDPSDTPKRADRLMSVALRLSARHVVADMRRLVEIVRASDRDWTIIRVPRLTDEPRQGRMIVGYVGRDMGITLSRADLAAFLLKQIGDKTYLHKAPMISN
jgi:putative NADH-flavin reductase